MRQRQVGWLAVGLLLLPGCSGQRADVSGAVQLDGRPVDEGAIQFIPVEGTTGPSAGGIIKDGRYHITGDRGVTVGKNRVELRAFRNTGRKVQDPTGLPGVKTDERVQAFPPEYNDRSTVVKEVHTGSNTIDFAVRTK